MNNEKQIGLAFFMYAQDYGGYLPPQKQGGPPWRLWSQLISPYLGKPDNWYVGLTFLIGPSVPRGQNRNSYGANYAYSPAKQYIFEQAKTGGSMRLDQCQ